MGVLLVFVGLWECGASALQPLRTIKMVNTLLNQVRQSAYVQLEGLARVVKCHRYGIYIHIYVKILEGWGKKCLRTHSYARLGTLGVLPPKYPIVTNNTKLCL